MSEEVLADSMSPKISKNAQLDILLIDKTNHHLFQPLLYEVASAALSPGEIAIPIREILRKQENATVMMGEIVQVDKKAHQLVLGNGEKVDYDYLVLAVGARHSYFGKDEWEKFAPRPQNHQRCSDHPRRDFTLF